MTPSSLSQHMRGLIDDLRKRSIIYGDDRADSDDLMRMDAAVTALESAIAELEATIAIDTERSHAQIMGLYKVLLPLANAASDLIQSYDQGGDYRSRVMGLRYATREADAALQRREEGNGV